MSTSLHLRIPSSLLLQSFYCSHRSLYLFMAFFLQKCKCTIVSLTSENTFVTMNLPDCQSTFYSIINLSNNVLLTTYIITIVGKYLVFRGNIIEIFSIACILCYFCCCYLISLLFSIVFNIENNISCKYLIDCTE